MHKTASFFISLLIVAAIGGIVFFAARNNSSPSPFATPRPTPAPTPKEKTVYSLLLIGHGGPGHDGGGLADTIMLLTVDIKTKKANFISVPRDTWIDNQKINNTFATGGGASTKLAVQRITGLEVDYFISIDFGGLQKAINILGGVDVSVPVTFDDYFYPIKGLEDENCGKTPEENAAINATMSGYLLEQQYTCRYEHLHFDRGTTHMDGETALKFVRSRHSAEHGGDFARSQRQQALLEAIKNKALSLGALDNIPEFFEQFRNIIKSDLDAAVIQMLYKIIGKPDSYKVGRINLTTDNVFRDTYSSTGAYILVPKQGGENFGPIHDFIVEQLAK